MRSKECERKDGESGGGAEVKTARKRERLRKSGSEDGRRRYGLKTERGGDRRRYGSEERRRNAGEGVSTGV